MSVKGAFMVPHPPLAVPAVGGKSIESIKETTDSYKAVAKEIALLKPDVIIITSPHATMYADYFHISPGAKADGSLRSFGAPQVKFSEQYDEKLRDRICELAKINGIAAGTLGEREPALDHGTMVPLWYIRNEYEGGKIVRIGLSGQSLTEHYRLGMIIKQAVEELDVNAVFVASGDLSHKLKDDGPYGFNEAGPEYDAKIMDVCARGAFGEIMDFDEDLCNRAAECGHRSFVIMAGALDGEDVDIKVYSHQDVTGVGYGICSFIPGKENEERHFLKEREERFARGFLKNDEYVRLARTTIETYINTGRKIKIPEGTSAELLNDSAGAFVSIHENGRLRGCIGTILPVYGCVAEEIINNAISASTNDPRFEPITKEELKWLEISVDVLGKPEKIDSKDELDVKRYGVIVSSGRRRGLLLPDLEGVDTVDEQVEIAMRKGGISSDDKITLERFEVIRHT